MLLAQELVASLGLETPPIAVTFLDQVPEDLARAQAPALAGCAYWSRAAEGQQFYTTAEDHAGCVVGMHTHAVPMPPDKERELNEQLGMMIGLDYVRESEVPQIPRRAQQFQFASYAPLASVEHADVVLVRGNARQMMLLAEAAQAAGLAYEGATLGRPTCAIVPQVLSSGKAVPSFGCIGNRIYAEVPDDELWYGLPGASLPALVAKLAVMAHANTELAGFHRGRLG